MRKVFVDLGAYDGDSIRHFMNRDDWKEFDIYAFEPNVKFHQQLADLWLECPNMVFLSGDAAWIENTQLEFAVDQADSPMGSTLMPGKVEMWNKSVKQTVQAFDFSEWLEQFADDYVIVKCDTEGAEFPILYKMIKDRTLPIMNELWCEFHPNKVREYTTTDKLELMNQIRQAGVELVEWH